MYLFWSKWIAVGRVCYLVGLGWPPAGGVGVGAQQPHLGQHLVGVEQLVGNSIHLRHTHLLLLAAPETWGTESLVMVLRQIIIDAADMDLACTGIAIFWIRLYFSSI